MVMIHSVATDKDVCTCSEKQYANIPRKELRAAFIVPEFPKCMGQPRGRLCQHCPELPPGARAGSTPAAIQPALLLTCPTTFFERSWVF